MKSTTRRRRRSWQPRLPSLLSLTLFMYLILQSLASERRTLVELQTSDMAHLATSRNPLKNLDPSDPNSHLSKILIPRAREYCLFHWYSGCRTLVLMPSRLHVADTANNTFVRNYIISTLKALKWHIEEDSFTDRTPYGTKHFTNVIATKDPDAPSKFVLSAHFDSKFFSTFPENQVSVSCNGLHVVCLSCNL
jgi:glutaminyl-peptide cyclotransferase